MTKSFHNHIFFSENILYLSVFHNQLNLKFGQNNDLEVWEQQIRNVILSVFQTWTMAEIE